MKRIFFFIAFFLSYFSGLYAQSKPIRNNSGLIIAMENSNGHIKKVSTQPEMIIVDTLGTTDTLINESIDALNAGESVLLQMQDSLTFTDPQGEVIATYNPVSKETLDVNGHLLFTMDESGQAIDGRGIVMARVDAEGNLYGNDGNKIAEAPGIDPYKLVYLFYYTNR